MIFLLVGQGGCGVLRVRVEEVRDMRIRSGNLPAIFLSQSLWNNT